jgi:hypothetical protein
MTAVVVGFCLQSILASRLMSRLGHSIISRAMLHATQRSGASYRVPIVAALFTTLAQICTSSVCVVVQRGISQELIDVHTWDFLSSATRATAGGCLLSDDLARKGTVVQSHIVLAVDPGCGL